MKNIVKLLFLLLFVACNYSNTKPVYLVNEDNKLVLPHEHLDFFPDINDMKLIFYSTSAEKMEHPYMPNQFSIVYHTKAFSCNKKLYLKNRDKIKKKAVKILHSDGDNYFIIDDERYLTDNFEVDSLRFLYSKFTVNNLSFCFHSVLAINDHEFYDPKTLSGLTSDFKIAILKFDNKFIILDQSYKYDWDVLSDFNKHGYIAGLAYSDKRQILIYNIVAW